MYLDAASSATTPGPLLQNPSGAEGMTQLDSVSRLMSLEPPLYLFGGFAEDAVLYGTVSRPHQDVDVLVWLDELPLRIEQGTRWDSRRSRSGSKAAFGPSPRGRRLIEWVGLRTVCRESRFHGPSVLLPPVSERVAALLVAGRHPFISSRHAGRHPRYARCHRWRSITCARHWRTSSGACGRRITSSKRRCVISACRT